MIRTETPAPWQAHHVFYTANTRPVLRHCVAPLIASLRADELVADWFFINYWVEGPHLRLRIRPVNDAAADTVRRRTEHAINDFLTRRPSLYHVSSALFAHSYDTLFELEFRPEERARYVDEHGHMRQREHNTFTPEPYEPEFGKYGGPAGIEIAEWHFTASSDLVLDVNATLNVHVRSVLLGIAAQLMLVLAAAFLRDREPIAEYFEHYHDFWNKAFKSTPLISDVDPVQAAAFGATIRNRLASVQQAIDTGDDSALPSLLRGWLAHCLDLRERVTAAADADVLRFARWGEPGEENVTEPDDALVRLLSPYLHMTNNRLQATLSDEAYLSLLIAGALREPGVEVAAS